MSNATFTGPGGSDPQEFILKALQVQPTPEAMHYAGAREITRIRQRTAQGTDVDGQPFAPYSPRYAKQRVAKGRNAAPVDLLMSGRMLTSMQVEIVSPTSFAISVTDADAQVYGRAHNDGAGHMPRRRFFDTSKTELDEMARDLGSLIFAASK